MAAVGGINFESFSTFVESICTEFNDGINKICEFSNEFFESEAVQRIGGCLLFAATGAAYVGSLYGTIELAKIIAPLSITATQVMPVWWHAIMAALPLLAGAWGALDLETPKAFLRQIVALPQQIWNDPTTFFGTITFAALVALAASPFLLGGYMLTGSTFAIAVDNIKVFGMTIGLMAPFFAAYNVNANAPQHLW